MKRLSESFSIWIPVAVALVARLAFIGRKSLWLDEVLASTVAGLGPIELVSKITSGTPHPPLGFLLIRFSSFLFGGSEAGLRLLTAVAVASAAIPVYRLVHRSIGTRAAFWSAMLWAVSPFSVSLGQEAWVYGLNIALSLWLLDLADLAWRGSKKALIGYIAVGIAGILTQHIFLISVIIASGYWFAVPREERIPWKIPLACFGFFVLAWLPVGLHFLDQFRARSVRMSAVGFESGFRSNLQNRVPSEFLRLISGGLFPEISVRLTQKLPMLIAYIVNGLLILYMLARAFFTRATTWRTRIWLLGSLLLPLALFWNDDPGIRQLAAVWMPFIFISGIAFGRDRWAGPVAVMLCLAALVPYYSLESFPYHRSDWRRSVGIVESLSGGSGVVLVIGGKSTGPAWDYYSTGEMERVAPGGNDPFLADLDMFDYDPTDALDSLMLHRDSVWFVIDHWGGISIWEIAEGYRVPGATFVSPDMEVGLIISRRVTQIPDPFGP